MDLKPWPQKYTTMPFGKHKGIPIIELDDGYCAHLISHHPNQDPELLKLLIPKAIKHWESWIPILFGRIEETKTRIELLKKYV